MPITAARSQDTLTTTPPPVVEDAVQTTSTADPDRKREPSGLGLLSDPALFTGPGDVDEITITEEWTAEDALAQAEKIAPGMMQRVTDQLGSQPKIVLEKGDSRGYWSSDEGAIHLYTDHDLDFIAQVLVMEMGNALNTEVLDGIYDLGMDGKVAREDFVERIEKAEFKTRMETMELWEQAEANGTVSGECIFDQTIRTWEDYWARAKDGPHAEQYREQWDYYCKAAWNREQRQLKKEEDRAAKEAKKKLQGKSNGIDK